MKLQDLRNALDATGTLVLSSQELGDAFDQLLLTCNGGQPITITGAELVEVEGGVVVSGTSSFLRQADLPITARLFVDEAGTVDAVLEYELIGEIPGPNPWTLSRSLPELPAVWNYETGSPLAPVDLQNEPMPVLPPQRPYVDSLRLSNARFAVSTSARPDPSTGTPLQPGINLVADLVPQGALGILESTLRSGPEPLALSGTIRIPKPTEVTRPQGLLETIWSRADVPGVHLQADLDLDLSLGTLVIDQTRLRIYSPHSTEWVADNDTFAPRYGYSARLAIPSADIEIELGANLTWGMPQATLYARPTGVTLGKLTHLVDLVGGGGLSASLPKPLQKAASALEKLALTYVALDVSMGATAVGVDAVAVEVGMPGLTWTVWKDDLVVRDLACRFEVSDPFGASGKRSVAVTVMGTVEIEGVAIAIKARSDQGFSLYAAMVDGSTIPLGRLMKRYASGVPAPADLTVTGLRLALAPGKSYSMATTVEGVPKPWQIQVGRSKLTVGQLALALACTGGKVSGSFAGTATYGKDLTLDIRYAIPGDVAIRSVIEDIKLSELIGKVASQAGSLPKGFDLTLPSTSVLIQKRGSDYVFQVGTQLEELGMFGFEVRKVASGWGFAAGLVLLGPLSKLPGLGALAPLERSFALEKLLVTVSSFDDASFQFPDMAQLQVPRLAGKGELALPPQTGMTAGLCAYGQWAIDLEDRQQNMLSKFLGLPSRLAVALQVGKDPAKQSKLYVDFTTTVHGNPLSCRFGAMMQNGKPALFLDGELSTTIDDQPVVFSVTMLLVTSGMFLSGTMAGTVALGGVKLSNLAVMTAVSWSGIPSLGLAATIDVSSFSSSIAVMFDSTDPSKSLFAGSVSDLTLADVASTLAGAKKLPNDLRKVLAGFGLSGTQPFSIPAATSTALDDLELEAVAQAFKAAGVPISSAPGSTLLVVGKAGKSWQLTDLRNKMRHYQLEKKGKNIRVTVNAQVYCAPQATTIGKLRFDQGFYLNGTLTVLGVSSTTTVEVSPNKGLAIDTSIDRSVVIYKKSFFSLSDKSGKKGPRLSVSTFSQPTRKDPRFRKPHFYLDGQIVLLGVKSSAFVQVTSGGAKFAIENEQSAKLGGKGVSGRAKTQMRLSGQVGAKALTAGGKVSVELSGSLTLGKLKAGGKSVDLGKIKLDFAVEATTEVGFANGKAYAKLSGRFVFQKEKFSFKTTLSVDQASLAKVERVVSKELEKLFTDAIKGPEKWVKWVNKGAVEGFKDAKKAAKTLKNVYRKSSKDTAKLLKGAGFAAEEVGDALQDAFKLSKNAMKDALEGAGYATKTVEKVTSKFFDSVGDEAKKLGKSIGKLFK